MAAQAMVHACRFLDSGCSMSAGGEHRSHLVGYMRGSARGSRRREMVGGTSAGGAAAAMEPSASALWGPDGHVQRVLGDQLCVF